MADVAGFSLKRGNFERPFTPEEVAYRTAHEAEWPERQRQNELRGLRVKADEALRQKRLDDAEADPVLREIPDVKSYYDRLRGRTTAPR